MVIGNVELMHECFLKHSRMGTARMKEDEETDEEGEKRGLSMERSSDSDRPTAYHYIIKIQEY